MSPRNAFALLPLLILAGLCLGLALLCRSAAALGSAGLCEGRRQARCKLAALAAARLACAQVAQELGPDSRWSGSGPDGIAWSARRIDAEHWQVLPLAGSAVDDGGTDLAWTVRDLTCGVDLAAPILAQDRSAPISRKSRMRQRLASGATQPYPGVAALSAARVCDGAALRAMARSETPLSVTVAGARSLLLDPVTGKWRENLSDAATLGQRLGSELGSALLVRSPELRDAPSRGLEPLELGDGQARLRHMPVLVDLALSLGVFNARSDGRHRVRFHVQMTLWNPSSLPLISVADKRLFLAEIEGAPEVTVTNLDSGATFSTWLDRCPPGVFWGYTQGPRERALWWWVEVLDTARYGMLRSGVLPGEVYSLLMPDPQAQPYGFSRVIGRDTWRLDEAEHPLGWLRPSPEVFLPTDRIRIAVRFVTPGTTLRLHPYVGALDASAEASDYATPALLTLAHVPWPDARIEVTGAEYSRPDSNGYVIGERRFCWRARLVARTDEAAFSIGANPALMGRVVDLADPACRACWALTEDALAEALVPVGTFIQNGTGVFRDAAVNCHDALTSGAFTDWRLRDIPLDPPLDVPSLRLLHGMTSEAWLADIDRAFFSCPVSGVLGPVSENPRLCPWQRPLDDVAHAAIADAMAGPTAAESLALEGAFNVNNTDPLAWEAFLCSDPVRWSADAGGPAPPGRIVAPAAFFSQPTGAMLAKYADSARCDLADDAITGMDADSRLHAQRRQSIRAPSTPVIRRFCECLCEAIASRDHPFAGLVDFFTSGVVERAIVASRLNESGAPAGPLCLDGPTLFGAHAALMVARGDTFAVRGEARVDGATMVLELTIQRVPSAAALPHLGRRFIITQARWVDASSR